MTLQVQICDSFALPPQRQTEGAAGYDLFSCESKTIKPNTWELVNTGIRIKLLEGTYGRIAPRSGLSCKGINVGAGVIDMDYTGLVKVLLFNHSKDDLVVKVGDRIAQLIIEMIKTPKVIVVDTLPETERGDKGFGSTGI